uniref:uncharacterized protein LOC120346740 n=1 Tax=Styela clava TaxID=7725 RepID=UPI00193ACC86|nr:uncharacterized protein LOC120346740 [Styela clava]
MSKQFLYACVVVSSILLVSVSAFDPNQYVNETVEFSIVYVEQKYSMDAISYISYRIGSLSPSQKLPVIDLVKYVFYTSISPKVKIVSFNMLHNLKPDAHSIPDARFWLADQISEIDPSDRPKWQAFVNELSELDQLH